MFVRSGTTWTQEAKLTASDGGNRNLFGQAVSLSGDTAIVGAAVPDAAYVFARSAGVWTEEAILVETLGPARDFGAAVSVFGDLAAVGAPNWGFGIELGSSSVFARSGGRWTEQKRVTAADGSPDDHFGCAVAISGDALLVGSASDDNSLGIDAGSAYVFGCACDPVTSQLDPSALDLRPSAQPLRVMRAATPGLLALTWEDTRAAFYHVYGGGIADLRPARPVPSSLACGLTMPYVEVDEQTSDTWFVVTAGCGLVESSYGRDALGRERDRALFPCP